MGSQLVEGDGGELGGEASSMQEAVDQIDKAIEMSDASQTAELQRFKATIHLQLGEHFTAMKMLTEVW